MKPGISVIVPVYNMRKFLHKCVDSILSQTFSDIEVILVNDGSTDESGIICDQYAKWDIRVKVLHKENGGLSSARNAGLKIAKGEYIGFVDSDDYIDINMYKDLYGLCKETNSDIAVCRFGREVSGNLVAEVQQKMVKEMDNLEAMRQLFRGELYRFSVCNKLFRNRCFDNIVFPEERIHEDLSTTYKLFSNANKIVFTNEVGYIYVRREHSILTSRFNEKRLDIFIGWEEILTFMKREYPLLSSEVYSCFTYACIDNVYYILEQVTNKKERKKYLLHIQYYVRRFYQDMIKNDALTFKYKNLISIIKYSVELFVFLNTLKNIRNYKL
ncbi:glycosyltransferase family 2 protein [Lederbergia citrea]|uniref:glycosyltransferase family 2 protein n=1 Tax=Lederbergia citrea TaxID=2833581 RepID=UPI001BC94289|nr:glycosyltransferase [Lederbergia citrea]MBS4179143.1 glycosyltransferase [Lederbergia citrea]